MTTQGDPEDPVLRLRITHITSTMSTPLPNLVPHYTPPHLATAIPPGATPSHLPVLRIFGTTQYLQKICANIHLCYPYFFVPFPMDSTSLDPLRPERVVRICQRFAVSLNHAICLATRQNPSNPKHGGATDPRHLHVVSVILVKGVPFYGYHIGYSYFLKVSLVNPSKIYVALEQLRKPVVLGREWQPFEAHMNHVLQFMCDFDLYGCGWLDLGGGTFRKPIPEGDPYASPPTGRIRIFDSLTTPPSMRYANNLSPSKDTFAPLEIDVLPHQILNRLRLKPRHLHQDFIELLHEPLDPDAKLVPAVRELWEDERRRRAVKGLSLSEDAMLPSGGMGGRTMAELGYKVASGQAGEKVKENRGGEWKRSDDMWEMLEERMREERLKTGKLTFERFSSDLSSGTGGEKRRYDKWILTTFEAVSAHWPKKTRPPRSTQRSRKSRRSVKSSPAPERSPSKPFLSSPNGEDLQPSSSPRRPDGDDAERKPNIHYAHELPHRTINDDDDDDAIYSDEDNPFEALALTQMIPDDVIEVNPNMIQSHAYVPAEDDGDDEDPNQRAHNADAHRRAEESAMYRATQAPRDESEYDDDELDELFRKTVTAGLSTPRKDRTGFSVTPTTGGSSASPASRRFRRDERLREQAGLGDLSTIMDRSSVSLSPANPFDDRNRTPTKVKTPISDKSTPTSLVRNIFARNRPDYSPLVTPSKPPTSPANTVVLTPTRRSVKGWQSPSPEPENREPTPTPSTRRNLAVELKPMLATKQEVKEIRATDDFDGIDIPAGQRIRSSKSSGESGPSGNDLKREPSPTFRDPEAASPLGTIVEDMNGAPPRKRVRMASPDAPYAATQGLLSSPPRPSQVPTNLTPLTASQISIPSNPTDDSALASNAWTFRHPPPSRTHILNSMEANGVDPVIYQEPHYSNPADVPARGKMFAGRVFTLKGKGLNDLDEFETALESRTKKKVKVKGKGPTKRSAMKLGWEYGLFPPSRKAVVEWCATQDAAAAQLAAQRTLLTSQLAKPTQKSRYGFKLSQKRKTKDSEREHQNMSVLAIEVFAKSRHQLLPDPEKDEITAVFYCYQNEDDTLRDTTTVPGYYAGYIVLESNAIRDGRLRLEGIPCEVVSSELDLINYLIDMVKGWDPDVLAGWELHNASWGYLSSRADQAFSIDLMGQLSRVVGGHTGPKKDFYSATHASTFKVSGRHILNIWRICRSEVNLTQYTFENVAFHVLRQRIPHYSSSSLTALWKSKTPEHTHRVLKYFFQRVVMYVEIIDAAEIITKNAEFARVFGVDFASVMFRGSQYKVESFMFRIAKPESFVLVSPSKQQVGLQNAPFAVPLIAEPESKYYTHPILVLDFQSLYPSVMIAYNICFSTCLGRVEKFKGTDKFGFTELKVADGLLELLKDYLTVTPNGMVFVKPAVRKSLLAKMLGEILDTRVMVKHAMKGARGDKPLTQLLNARQLGLKLMANVTYGYTSATYSGRMPCIEVADSIVQTGRETLEKAQELIHSRPDWNAQVVYGDTDSLFVALPGRSKEQAFIIGNAIADTVTAMNPKPVRLKFEKVYMGSVLMAKKRYVGFKYEHPDETEPVFDAKGIETIRRDGFPAQQKIEEVCLKMLFRNQDLSEIKEFCRQEWTKILQGRVSMQDFIVAKEVRLGSYSDKGVPPPGAAVAYRRILKDPRDEPQYAERVPYIISNADGRRLIDRARMPEEMLANRSLSIDAEYYIRNLLIPPLSRIFNLVGADVENWFDSMPRTKRAAKYDFSRGKMRIDSHFKSSHCAVCGNDSTETICSDCVQDPSRTSHALLSREHLAESRLSAIHKICASCSSTPVQEPILCDSIDCPITYARTAAVRDVEDLQGMGTVLEMIQKEDEDNNGQARSEQQFRSAWEW